MKKIYALLALIVILFAGSYLILDYNLVQEEAVLNEKNSAITLESDSDTTDVVPNASSLAMEESSESAPESSQAVVASEMSIEAALQAWQGPDSTYLNAEGNLIDLADNYGKGTLINIWASWCEPCRVEMPYFEEAYQTYGDDINFLMIDALESRPTETQAAALAFFEEMELSMPIYFDNEMANQFLFGATILPLTLILDDEGKVIEIVRGQVSPAKLTQMINKIL